MGIKPIFEKERLFFKEKTNIDLPTDCWRDGNKIYLDIYHKEPLYRFKVVDGEIKIVKDNSSKQLNKSDQIKIVDIVEREKDRLNQLYEESFNFLLNYLIDHGGEDIIFCHSAGKDSCLSYYIFKNVLDELNKRNINLDYVINFANTSNDTSDTYKFIKNNDNVPQDKLKIMNPKEGFYQWIERKNYFLPSALVRNCCSTYKEGQLKLNYDTKKPYTFIIGVRKYESVKRNKYDWIMDAEFYRGILGDTQNMPKPWINIAPIIQWEDKDVWLFILMNDIKINDQYYMGYNRCGCIICPYQSDYIDVLTSYFYPKLWNRWKRILTKSHEIHSNKHKWSLQEYINGAWKGGKSKVHMLSTKPPTKENVEKLMEIMDISDESVALKYFIKKCSKCEKKMNPTEIAMNLKLFGRNIDIDSNGLCKKCMCEDLNISATQYSQKVMQFTNSGCNLF